MDMQEACEFVKSLGVPVAFAVAFGYALYKIGVICGTVLIDAWKAKDTRLEELEKRVERINNGQRESLEKRFDLALESQRQGTETTRWVGTVLHEQAEALRGFVRQCPMLTDSDADRLRMEIDDKTREVIARRQARLDKGGSENG